ncbi:MAG: 4-hydroxy-tetrahydrodipicolinate synthase [Bdellovibrionales bacterium]
MEAIKGLYTALVTPFSEESVDYESLSVLLERQVQAGADGVVILGSTGEPATISCEERQQIVQNVVDQVDHRIDVVVGVGESCTGETIERALAAQELGADGLLVVSPYGNKPPQRGLEAHFSMVADRVDILYNIPCRTGTYIEPSTVVTLSEHENIIGVKDASSNFVDMAQIVKEARNNFSVISGNDNETLNIMKLGGQGVIAVSSNIIPEKMKQFIDRCASQNWEEATALHNVYMPFFEMLFCDTNPIPAKTILAYENFCDEVFRLPLVPMERAEKEDMIELWHGFKRSLG